MTARTPDEQVRSANPDDPTQNVLEMGRWIERVALLREKRQDDLRKKQEKHRLEIRRIQERCNDELDTLRKELAVKESERLDAKALAEQRRLDANRAQDVANVALANVRAEGQAAQLADRVETARKALDVTEGGRAQSGITRQGTQWLLTLLVGGGIALGVFGGSQLLKSPQPIQVTVVVPSATPAPTR